MCYRRDSRTDAEIDGLTPYTLYQMRVRARLGADMSEWSRVCRLATDETAPGPPRNFTVTAEVRVLFARPMTSQRQYVIRCRETVSSVACASIMCQKSITQIEKKMTGL